MQDYTALGPLLTARNDGTDLFLDGVMRALQWSGWALACTNSSNLAAWQRVIREESQTLTLIEFRPFVDANTTLVRTERTCWNRLHSDAGPAVTYKITAAYYRSAVRTAEFRRFGALHNTRGAAITYRDGQVHYYERGICLSVAKKQKFVYSSKLAQ